MRKVKVLEEWLLRIRAMLSHDKSRKRRTRQSPRTTLLTPEACYFADLIVSVASTSATDNAHLCWTFFACCGWDKVHKVSCRQTSKACFWRMCPLEGAATQWLADTTFRISAGRTQSIGVFAANEGTFQNVKMDWTSPTRNWNSPNMWTKERLVLGRFCQKNCKQVQVRVIHNI